jgi:predicted PolB exonuclease-like 3'-5' exonuclease
MIVCFGEEFAAVLQPVHRRRRYTDDAVDLCDVLSSFSSRCKVTLHELCRVMGLPGKPVSGADVERCYREGRIREIAEYCENDVVNTTMSGYGMNSFEAGYPL